MLKGGDRVLIKGSNVKGTVVNQSILQYYENDMRYLIRRDDCNNFVFGYMEKELELIGDEKQVKSPTLSV